MTFTFFGIIWISFIIWAFVDKRQNALVYILLFSMVLQCDNVVILGERGIGPGIVTSIVYIIKSVFFVHSRSKETCLRYNVSLGGLFLFFMYILVFDILNGDFENHGLQIAQLFIYLSCTFMLYRNSVSFSFIDIDRFIKTITIFLLVVGLFQFFATGQILPKFELITDLLYNDTGPFVYYHTQSVYWRVLSTFMEPSYYSTLLVGLFFYVLYREKYIKKSYLLMVFILVELVLTFSSTGYVIFIVFMIIYFVLVGKIQYIVRLIPLLLILMAFLMYMPSILDDVIFNKMETNSGMERNKMNEIAMEVFNNNMLYGIGYKEIRASSFVISVAAECGIIGLFLYSIFFVSQNIHLLNRRVIAKVSCETGTRMMVACCIMGQFIACPDLELSTFWLTMYLCSISANK